MTQTRSDLTANLARALNIKPDEIMRYEQYPDGYSVLTNNFQKFTQVQPVAVPAPSPVSVSVSVSTPIYPEGITTSLEYAFNNPYDAKVKELRQVAYALDITDASALLKVALQEEIDIWKKENGW